MPETLKGNGYHTDIESCFTCGLMTGGHKHYHCDRIKKGNDIVALHGHCKEWEPDDE